MTQQQPLARMRVWYLLAAAAVLFATAAFVHSEKWWAVSAIAFTVSAIAARYASKETCR